LRYGNIGNIKIENVSLRNYKIDVCLENIYLNFYINSFFAYKNIKETQNILNDAIKDSVLNIKNSMENSNIHWEHEPSLDDSKSEKESSFMLKFLEKCNVGVTIKNVSIEISQEIPTRLSPLMVCHIKQIN